jgi:hypothetical protein
LLLLAITIIPYITLALVADSFDMTKLCEGILVQAFARFIISILDVANQFVNKHL